MWSFSNVCSTDYKFYELAILYYLYFPILHILIIQSSINIYSQNNCLLWPEHRDKRFIVDMLQKYMIMSLQIFLYTYRWLKCKKRFTPSQNYASVKQELPYTPVYGVFDVPGCSLNYIILNCKTLKYQSLLMLDAYRRHLVTSVFFKWQINLTLV
jgi:hypothetical protein